MRLNSLLITRNSYQINKTGICSTCETKIQESHKNFVVGDLEDLYSSCSEDLFSAQIWYSELFLQSAEIFRDEKWCHNVEKIDKNRKVIF